MSQVNSVNCGCRPISSRQEVPSYRVDKEGNYHFYATSKDDRIHVNREKGQVNVRINDRQMTLSLEEARNMSIYAGAGDDKVVLGRGLPPGIKVYGGPGNDKIVNHSNRVFIDGGSGNDKIVNHGNNCRLNGSSGNDSIISTGRGNVIDGGAGRNRISAAPGNHVTGGRRRMPGRFRTRTRAQGRPQAGAAQGRPRTGVAQGQPRTGAAQGQPRTGAAQGRPRNVAADGRPRTGGAQSRPHTGAAHNGQRQQGTSGGSKINGWDLLGKLSPPDPVSRKVSKVAIKLTKAVVGLFKR